MRFLEKLFGCLSEIVDESDDGVFLQRIFDAVNVHVILEKEWMEQIDGLHGGRPLLFAAENQVDPFVQVLRHVVAFQGGPVQPDEFAWVAFGPGRQNNVVQGDSALFAAQVEPVSVDEKVRQVKEFWDELLDVGHVELGSRPPGLSDRMEQPVSQIEMSALQLKELLGEGLETDQIGADDHGRRVVGAVVIRARLVVRIVPFLVAFAELLEALARLRSHRLGQVAESGRL